MEAVLLLLAETGLEVVLVHPRQACQIPGRMTDVADSVWLADLAAHGLLRRSFVPPKPVRELQDLVRTRTTVVRSWLSALAMMASFGVVVAAEVRAVRMARSTATIARSWPRWAATLRWRPAKKASLDRAAARAATPRAPLR